jgi:probable HAF family extracellular repeat protein
MTHLGKALLAGLLPPLLATVPAQAGPAYHLTDLGPDTVGNRIDGNGEICGWQRGHPAVYSNGTWRVLQGSTKYQPNGLDSDGFVVGTRNEKGEIAVEWDPSGAFKHVVPGALSSFATAIHRDGTVYGAALMPTGHAFPYTWNNGVLTQLPYAAGWAWTMPTAVNRSQQMSGWAANAGYEPACPMDPVIYSGGTWSSLGSLGGTCGQAEGINDSGVVVGWSFPLGSSNGHAFMWQSGVMTDLGTLGGPYSEAEDIDEQGRIVGVSNDSARDVHPFIWSAGVMRDLSGMVDKVPHKAFLDEARSTNAAGQILVQGHFANGSPHAFLLDPL